MNKVSLKEDNKSDIPSFPPKKRNLTNLLINGAIALSIGGIGYFIGSQNQGNTVSDTQPVETVNENILKVKTIKIRPVSSYLVSRSYTGETSTVRESVLGFERGGKVEKLYVNEGDRIKQGTAIAKLDTSKLEVSKLNLAAQIAREKAILAELETGARPEDITAAQATVKQLAERLQLEKIKQERREYLYKEGAISREQLDEVSFNRNVLTAQLQEAQSRLDELLAGTRIEKIDAQKAVIKQLEASVAEIDLDIRKSFLESPYDGTISQRLIDEGTVVSTGQGLVKLVENNRPEVRIGIPTDKVDIMEQRSNYEVIINNKSYNATLSAILPEVDPATRTQTLVLTLDNNTISEIPSGAIARLNLTETIATSGYWLPTTGLIRGNRGLWSCYAVVKNENGDTIVEKRDIEILYTDSNRVLVRGTLQSGDLIVTQGTQRIVPQQMVITVNY
ncbi:MAG: efflux RND transporter periplasmic adaptor subunit [Microcystaceae cyanobacterium]